MKLLGVTCGLVGDRLLRCSYSGLDMLKPETWLRLADAGLDSLIIDSFNAASPTTDENDARSALMLQHAGTFAEVTGCGAIVIHHARKGTGGDDREMVRGSTALYAAVDRAYKFGEPDTTVPGRIQVTMTPIKFGAGTPMGSIRLELSDAEGLKWVEMPKEQDPLEKQILDYVRGAGPEGIWQSELVEELDVRKASVGKMLRRLKNEKQLARQDIGRRAKWRLNPERLP
jgi:predicted RNA-binding protein with PIN domain